MTDFTKIARKSPGTEEAALLALTLINDLLGLLRDKGMLSADDVTSLLETTADSLSKNPSAFAKRGAGFRKNVSESIFPRESIFFHGEGRRPRAGPDLRRAMDRAFASLA